MMELLIRIRAYIALDLQAVARRRYREFTKRSLAFSLALRTTVNYNWQTQCAARSLRQLVIHDNGTADV